MQATGFVIVGKDHDSLAREVWAVLVLPLAGSIEVTGGSDLVAYLEFERTKRLNILLPLCDENDLGSHYFGEPIQSLSNALKRILPATRTVGCTLRKAFGLVALLLEKQLPVRSDVLVSRDYRPLGNIFALRWRWLRTGDL